MRHVTIRTTDGREITVPAEITSRYLTECLGKSSLTLGNAIPLKNGGAHRSFRFVGQDDKVIDLSGYQDIFSSDRNWIGRIEAA
jgi:hypothetical protein